MGTAGVGGFGSTSVGAKVGSPNFGVNGNGVGAPSVGPVIGPTGRGGSGSTRTDCAATAVAQVRVAMIASPLLPSLVIAPPPAKRIASTAHAARGFDLTRCRRATSMPRASAT